MSNKIINTTGSSLSKYLPTRVDVLGMDVEHPVLTQAVPVEYRAKAGYHGVDLAYFTSVTNMFAKMSVDARRQIPATVTGNFNKYIVTVSNLIAYYKHVLVITKLIQQSSPRDAISQTAANTRIGGAGATTAQWYTPNEIQIAHDMAMKSLSILESGVALPNDLSNHIDMIWGKAYSGRETVGAFQYYFEQINNGDDQLLNLGDEEGGVYNWYTHATQPSLTDYTIAGITAMDALLNQYMISPLFTQTYSFMLNAWGDSVSLRGKLAKEPQIKVIDKDIYEFLRGAYPTEYENQRRIVPYLQYTGANTPTILDYRFSDKTKGMILASMLDTSNSGSFFELAFIWALNREFGADANPGLTAYYAKSPRFNFNETDKLDLNMAIFLVQNKFGSYSLMVATQALNQEFIKSNINHRLPFNSSAVPAYKYDLYTRWWGTAPTSTAFKSKPSKGKKRSAPKSKSPKYTNLNSGK